MKTVFVDNQEYAATMVEAKTLQPGDYWVPLEVLGSTNQIGPHQLSRVEIVVPSTQTGFMTLVYRHPYDAHTKDEYGSFLWVISETLFVFQLRGKEPNGLTPSP